MSSPTQILEGVTPSAPQPFCKPLVWYVDINATIMMSDPTGGKSMSDVINNSLARIAWGTVSHHPNTTAGLQWNMLVNEPLSLIPSEAAQSLHATTYDTAIDEILYPPPSDFDDHPPEQRKKIWADVRKQRQAMKKTFTLEGQPGHSLRREYEQMRDSLYYPNGSAVGLIPTFFHTVSALLVTSGVPLYVVFRTFGEDGHRVCDEWNAFVTGTHPYQPLPAGIDASHLVVTSKHVGSYHRRSSTITVTWSSPQEQTWEGSIVDIQSKWTERFMKENPGGAAFCIRDDYAYWAAGRERAVCGKPIAVHAALPYYSIFSDDNIRTSSTDRGIVDCRDALTGESLHGNEVCSRYLMPVDSYAACVDKEYFLTLMRHCVVLQNIMMSLHGGSKE